VTLLRDMPFGTLYFATYEVFNLALKHYDKDKFIPKSIKHLISGGAAGFVSTTLTIPFDVIKTRLQTQATLPPNERIYTSTWQTFKIILKDEGFMGLTRGLGARLVYLTPAGSITFTTYEYYKIFLGVK